MDCPVAVALPHGSLSWASATPASSTITNINASATLAGWRAEFHVGVLGLTMTSTPLRYSEMRLTRITTRDYAWLHCNLLADLNSSSDLRNFYSASPFTPSFLISLCR